MRLWPPASLPSSPASSASARCARWSAASCRRREALVVESAGAAAGLDVAAALLAFEAPLLRTERRLGRPTRRWPYHGFAQQFDQAIDGIGAVALLGAEALGVDHDHAVLGHAL